MSDIRSHATASLAEADRLMTVCNSCRYCEGLCAVFPAMELRRAFTDGDLNYLSNLCHQCGACYVDCQFSPPHEFQVNVPKVFAEVRADSYAAYAWPAAAARAYGRNGLFLAVVTAASTALFVCSVAALNRPSALFASGLSPGRFYRLIPHPVMAGLFGAAFLYALAAIGMGLRAFWRDMEEPARTLADWTSIWRATKDAAGLRYLDGGGAGCYNGDEPPTDRRRLFHHLTFYGFLLCLAATTVATLYHYLLGREAPYAWYDAPVLLGAAGGLGLVIGPAGLFAAKRRRNPAMVDPGRLGMDLGFSAMLIATSLSGLMLLLLRGAPAMGLTLALHLGFVFSLFVTMPYSKFVHGLYRFAALVRSAKEQRALAKG